MIKAVIFDLNGTVLDDEKLYRDAFRRVVVNLGHNVSDEFSHIRGIGVVENWTRIVRDLKINTNQSMEVLGSLTQKEYVKLFDKVQLKKGFKVFVNNIKKLDILTALATSNTWSIVERVFDKFDIENLFDFVTTSDEVTHNKPSPEIFMLTAEKLVIESTDCLVIEDSDAGIEAAVSAGMKVIRMGNEKLTDAKSEVKIAVESFDEIPLSMFKTK